MFFCSYEIEWTAEIDEKTGEIRLDSPEIKPPVSETDSDPPSDEPPDSPPMLHRRSSSVTSLVEDAVKDREADPDTISEMFQWLGHTLVINRVW